MKCLYVYNPTSGKQNSHKKIDYILRELKKKFEVVDCKPTQKRGDAGVFAREACGVYDVFVVSGGDGTMNEVVNAISEVENRPQIGYIPAGTTNDLAHSLGISKNIKKAVRNILNGHTIKHDVFKVNDRYGIYVCCFGIFTKSSYATSQTKKKHLGRIAYFTYGVREMFSSKAFPMTIEYDGKKKKGKYALGIIANSKYVAGYKINNMASFDDGYVNVILVSERKKKKVAISTILRIFRLFLFGMKSLKDGKKCRIIKVQKLHVDLPAEEIVNLDGESGFGGSFDLEVLKQHIDIFVKEK